MQWSDRYATGIAHLDEQHKMLFRIAADYRAALNEGRGERVCGVLLESLETYARAHFGMEAQCMWRLQCPAASANDEAHDRFTDALSRFRRRHVESGFLAADARRLVDFLDSWLGDHVGRIDVRLKPCVEKAASRGDDRPC